MRSRFAIIGRSVAGKAICHSATRCRRVVDLHKPGQLGGIGIRLGPGVIGETASVTFKVKNYRVEGPARYTTMTFDTNEFIRRFLIHVLPKGFHRIRHYGLFAGAAKATCIAAARKLLGMPAPVISTAAAHEERIHDPDALIPPCPCCGARMRIIERFKRGETPRHGRRRVRAPSESIRHDEAERPPQSRVRVSRSIRPHRTTARPSYPAPPNRPPLHTCDPVESTFNHRCDLNPDGEHRIRVLPAA
jgi:Putative transposase